MEQVWAILVAGGIGNRFGGKLPKQFLNLAGKKVLDYSLDLFTSLPEIAGTVLVLPQDFIPAWQQEMAERSVSQVRFAPGGLSRQRSVQNGLKQVAEGADWIIIHDVARPLVTAALIRQTLAGAKETGAAVTALAVSDTLKKGDDSQFVVRTVSREQLYSVQTPQAFSKKVLEEALKWAESKGMEATDEAGIVEQMGHRVRLVEGSVYNFKITRREDLKLAEAYLIQKQGGRMSSEMRIGQGYDVHPFVAGRDLVLGGVKIPFEKGLKGHSDADALTHALCDALLGAVAAGDLGKHFPDSDPKYRGISSLILLAEVARLVQNKGFKVSNVDTTLVCQKPKLAPYLSAMRENIARTLKIDVDCVGIKATTEEGLGFTGRMEGLAAKAVVLLHRS